MDPFFINIDVQGCEMQVIQGGENTIKTHQPVLLVESPGRRVSEYLRDRGYQSYAFERGLFLPGIRGKPNTFFMTDSRASMVKKYIGGAQ